jgi:hypothetical protein
MFLKVVSRICVVVVVSAAVAGGIAAGPGQNGRVASVGPPLLGFVVDDARGLRPLVGIPGSASIGNTVPLGFEISHAAVSPRHDYILALTPESNWPRLLQVRDGLISIHAMVAPDDPQTPRREDCDVPADMPHDRRRPHECRYAPVVADTAAAVDRIALSPAGTAAAFYSETARRIYVFGNMAQSPAFAGAIDVAELGSVSAFGISDDGGTVALGVSDGQNGSLFVLSPRRPAQWVSSMRHPVAIGFLHGSDSAFIADDVDNKIVVLSNGHVMPVATETEGISGPIALAVSKDNQRVFAANSGSGSVTTIGPAGFVSEPRYCNCALKGLYPTNNDSVFRLTDFAGGPVLLLDGNSSPSRLIFVPMSGSH